jgi:phosphatidylinositol 4-kinase A
VKIAWAENPSIALELVSRFGSVKTRDLVRWQILNFPQKVIDEPDALELLLGNSLPHDVSFQLKVASPVPHIMSYLLI